MKNNTLFIGTFIALSSLIATISLPLIVFGQTNEQVIDSLLWTTSTRWYTAADKNAVKITSKTATTVTIEAPLAKKDGKDITSYYITWAPISYKDITATSNTEDLAKVKESDTTKLSNGSSIYKVQWGKLIITLEVLDPNKDVYVTISPEDANKNFGWLIEDFKFNINNTTTATTAVAGDIFNNTSNKAIDNVSCVWDATDNRTTLTWDINTAMTNATKVEISNKPNETQGDMTVKWTPNITERRFVVDTAHRDIQLFRLKPLDSAGAMVGIEIQYICKPDTVEVVTPPEPRQPIVPTDPKRPIPVTPHTGPIETTAIIFFISLLGYFVYRKMRA